MAEIQLARIKSLYGEVKGLFESIKGEVTTGPFTVPKVIGDNFNKVVDEVSRISGTDYSRSKIPDNELRSLMSVRLVKPLMSSFITRLEQEYNFNLQNSGTPVIQPKSFHFISSDELRTILERDYLEIQRNIISANWKSAIILSGGAIETILLDVAQKNTTIVSGSKKVPAGKSNPTDWVLNDLIEICLDVQIVSPELGKLSHGVRQYRNLVHPAVELRQKMKVEPEEAKIAVEILNILIRELS